MGSDSNKQESIVLIPIHKSNPSANELVSFDQCFRVFNQQTVLVLAPEELDITIYRDRVKSLMVEYIPAHWLASLQSYNALKKSSFFYGLFRKYKYLLTYELDAFVFKDELNKWCKKEYDYIGAPWLEGFHTATEKSKLLNTGNSGFSLRNIKTCVNICRKVEGFQKVFSLVNKLPGMNPDRSRTVLLPFLPFFRCFGTKEFFQAISNNLENDQEDFFWSMVVPKFHRIKIAPVEEAVAFSFEVQPKKLFAMNKGDLPFGCHAWWRYDTHFWRNHIPFPVNNDSSRK